MTNEKYDLGGGDRAVFETMFICQCNARYFGRITPYQPPDEHLDPKAESMASAQRIGWRPIPDSEGWSCPDCSALAEGKKILNEK